MKRPRLLPLFLALLVGSVGRAQTDATLVDVSVSPGTARDGVTLRLGYRIAAPGASVAWLGGRLRGPRGEELVDASNDRSVAVQRGTNWYYRGFFINLPPGGEPGSYAVTWDARGGGLQGAALTRANALQVLPPHPCRVAILAYHKVAANAPPPDAPGGAFWVDTEDFRRQMRALKAYGYTSISLDELMNARAGLTALPPKAVLITFDDGYENTLTEACPVLADPAIDFKATVFLPTGRVGHDTSWNLPDGTNPVLNHLTWAQIGAMQASGRIDFESHTVTHLRCDGNPPSLAAELAQARLDIATRLGTPSRFIAWPHGAYDTNASQRAWEQGYFAAFSFGRQGFESSCTNFGCYLGIDEDCRDKWDLKRVFVGRATTLDYNPADRLGFFFSPLNVYDPAVPVPAMTVGRVECVAPDTGAPFPSNRVQCGQSVLVRVQARNAGPAARVLARLAIGSGVAAPGGPGIVREFAAGVQEFAWEVPLSPFLATGRYAVAVSFRDAFDAVGYGRSGWSNAFNLVPAADADADSVPDWWEQRVFGSLTRASRYSDSDGDRATDADEFWAGTDPTHAHSVLGLTALRVATDSTAACELRWQSASNRSYRVLCGTNLCAAFAPASPVLPATPPLNVHTAAPPAATAPVFYRVQVAP